VERVIDANGVEREVIRRGPRGKYVCGRCGQAKEGHICPVVDALSSDTQVPAGCCVVCDLCVSLCVLCVGWPVAAAACWLCLPRANQTLTHSAAH
jgi:hypothetical protein